MKLKISTKEFANNLNKSTSYVYDNLNKLVGRELLFAKKDSNNKYVLVLNPFFDLKTAKFTALQDSKELKRKIADVYAYAQMTAKEIISDYNSNTLLSVKKECDLFANDKTISNIDATISTYENIYNNLSEREELVFSIINSFSADMINKVCISEHKDSVYLYINTSTNKNKAELFNALAGFDYTVNNATIFEKDKVVIRISNHLPSYFSGAYRADEIEVESDKKYANDILIFFKDAKEDFKFKFV